MFVHTASRSLLFQADPAVIARAVPAVAVEGPGYSVAAKHTAAATLALRGMGYEAPSPIVAYYDWPKFKGKYPPFDHQRAMAEFMTLHRRCFNLGEMGTGKTNSVLWALDWMMTCGEVDKALITSPLSTLELVWLTGIMETIMHRKAVVLHGSREKRLKLLASDADIYIVNHEGLCIKPLRDAIRARKDINLVVVDEGSKFRNAKTDRYRALEQIVARPTMRLWWLTGTPCPSGPDNAWAQARLVSPDRVPKFYGQFRDKVMIEVSEHIWKPRAGSADIAHAAMQPAIRFAKADCLDLPPMVMVDMACELSGEQKAAYKQMASAMMIADKALLSHGQVIAAANAADRVNKLRQIMLGSVKCGPDTYETFDSGPRVKVILEAIEQASAKVIVIVPFKGAIKELAARLGKHYSVAIVNGDVSLKARNEIFTKFKTTPDPHVLLCHPEVMSHGLNLVEADTLIFAAPMYGNDAYRQVCERMNRPGQTRKMTLVRVGCNALEWAIYKALDNDEDHQQMILNLYSTVVGGSN